MQMTLQAKYDHPNTQSSGLGNLDQVSLEYSKLEGQSQSAGKQYVQ